MNTIRYENRGTTAKTLFIVIDNYQGATGSYLLTTSVEAVPPAPAGDACENATPITTPGTLTGQTTTGYTNNLAPVMSCSGYGAAGPDHIYAITVPARQKLTATVGPETGATGDPALHLVAGPAASCATMPTPCLAGDDSGNPSMVNRVAWTNTSAADATIFVVDSINAPVTAFTLTTQLAPP